MKMALKMRFRLIVAALFLFNELAQPASQIPLNNSARIRLRKDTEVQSAKEDNPIPPKSTPNQAPSQPTNDHQSTERPFLHFPNPKKLPTLNPATIRSAKLIEATPTKTTNPLLPKLPAKFIDTRIGQSANFPPKAKSGQLSIKQTPETPEPTTNLVPDSVKPKNKKPVARKPTPAAETTENPPSASSKQPKKKKPALKSEEPTTESTTTANPSYKKLGGIRTNTENRYMNPPQVVPKIKHLTILPRLTVSTPGTN